MAGTNTIISGASASRIQEELDRMKAAGEDMSNVSVANNPIGGGSTTVALPTYQATGGKEYGNPTLLGTNKPPVTQAPNAPTTRTLTAADYQIKQGETPAQYNARIAASRGDSSASLANMQNLTTSALGNPVSAPSTGTSSPNTPAPHAGNIQSEYLTSLTSNLQQQRSTYEQAIAAQRADLQKQMTDSQAKIDNLTTLQQEGVLSNVKELSQPFRDKLEQAQREFLYVNQNLEANQKLMNELGDLLQQGNDLIKQQKDATGLASIRNPRIAQTISDVAARAGVIQAVMSARNGQISVAENMIDRTANAIAADRTDQINYYKALNDFYKNQKDDEGKKLITLTSQEQKYIDSQIKLLDADLQRTQDNADALKKAMQDPDTALQYALSGVTLNDTPQQINQKLATYAYSKEVADTSNSMAKDGYSTTPIAGVAPVTTTDSKGVVKNWYKKGTTTTTQSPEEKMVANFLSDLTNTSAEKGALNREQFIRNLEAKYPGIDSTPHVQYGPGGNVLFGGTPISDIARKVYETYPDSYENDLRKKSSNNSSSAFK